MSGPAHLLAGAALATVSATPVWAQALGGASEPQVAWWRVLAALALCLALAVGGALALRARLGGQAPALRGFKLGLKPAAVKRLRLVESLRVSHQVDVCLVSCDGAEFIVAASPQGAAITPAPRPESA